MMRILSHVLACCLIAIMSSSCEASPFDELMDSSSEIAQVTIVRGDVVSDIGMGCGSRYTAVVTEPIKNSSKGDEISFRIRKPLLLGGTYLIFTDKAPKDSTSTNAAEKLDSDEPKFLLAYRSIECSRSSASKTIAGLGKEKDYAAIFELRRLGGRATDDLEQYFVGPAPVVSILPVHLDTRTLYVEYSEGQVYQGAIPALEFLRVLRDYSGDGL